MVKDFQLHAVVASQPSSILITCAEAPVYCNHTPRSVCSTFPMADGRANGTFELKFLKIFSFIYQVKTNSTGKLIRDNIKKFKREVAS